MRKTWIALLCMILCGCNTLPKEPSVNYEFTLAVIDNGPSGLEITYYDAAYQEMGRTRLPDRHVNNDYSIYRDTVYHDSFAYMAPAAGIIPHQNELIRMNLQNGQIDTVQLEDFATWDIFADDEKLQVIQSSPAYVYWRTEIPFDGSKKTITKYSDHVDPGRYFRVKEGWIRAVSIPRNDLYLYNDDFEQLDYLSLGETYNPGEETKPQDPFNVSAYDGVYIGGSLYVPAQKENRRWEKMPDGIYEPAGFEGYTFGLMKINTDPLSYEIIGDPERMIGDIEQLDETRIILCTTVQKLRSETHGNETSYSYENSEPQLTVYDTAGGEFEDYSFAWQPQSVTRASDVLYVIDFDEVIHVLDPDTLQEIRRLDHQHSDIVYSLARLVPADSYR